MNPWQQVPLDVYEGHMRLDTVGQLQALDALYRQRLSAYRVKSVAFWGIAGGNGLSHINPVAYEAVYGLDINEAYLGACRSRYPALHEKLTLICADLSRPVTLPYAELVFADLLMEYIGLIAFAARIKESLPRILCCTIQQNLTQSFVSPSPYAGQLSGIGSLHTDIEACALTDCVGAIGYRLCCREEIPLVNGKQLIRLDYMLQPA